MNQKELLWISITIFLTIVAWMFVDIYLAGLNINRDVNAQSLQVIDFNLNTDVLNEINNRQP
ncbi:hypothetical protein A2866_05390 [Candidatus Roizmanbacteria bacterium RIFCSPHIGHO2_01_FULL_39_8]|uniref:Uncharacterized protein n=3 Tax=Candidatus Roizmaniibacteriota TaxID=1752723 RepID=A0A1F7GTR1_9BACT|nr:MAG: hypothetical protein A2866_05390 [Candidatus Roizmanbacteria bacterium RIFCSPHIGHO2_01_FULL_39_8]OGK25542.1 MAG: hypothetical protein A3C28_01650 [Candidatus Roizmanbacteria bacterium RIFCSPHIGHO2_02_FULL_39_9]OGK35074.1 MAG: hypothetical protein A3F60_03250 [Candidatus Roizmanbacteria bacterium RIFCSPHIGHO2_12_FULL_39_8]